MAWNDFDRLRERFSFVCSAQLDDISATNEDRVLHCAKCDTSVYEAASATEFDHHARLGRCVSVVSRHGVTLMAKPDDPDDGEPLPVPAMVGKVDMPEPIAPPTRLRGKVKRPEPEPTQKERLKRWWKGLWAGD
jgi:hypothetical protein